MSRALDQAIVGFLERSTAPGIVADLAEVRSLNRALGGIIPEWYISLITTYPLCGVELGWREPETSGGDGDVRYLEWFGPEAIRSEMLECHPGVALLRKGYVCVAGCSHGSGDQYFIPTDVDDNPPLYQIAHDVSADPDVIIAKARSLVARHLSDFFVTVVP